MLGYSGFTSFTSCERGSAFARLKLCFAGAAGLDGKAQSVGVGTPSATRCGGWITANAALAISNAAFPLSHATFFMSKAALAMAGAALFMSDATLLISDTAFSMSEAALDMGRVVFSLRKATFLKGKAPFSMGKRPFPMETGTALFEKRGAFEEVWPGPCLGGLSTCK